MKTANIIFICVATVVLSCSNSTRNCSNTIKEQFTVADSPEQVGFSSERLARIDSFMQNAIKIQMFPNAATFIARHGKIVYQKAFGYKNIEKQEPLSNTDIFRIASQSKAIVTVGLMMLYEQGKFLLDDPISMYIPAFKNPQVLVTLNEKDSSYTTRPADKEITIRHLLSHTSGITYENAYYIKNHIPLVNSLGSETIGKVVNRLAKLPLKHDPGKEFTYGLNIDVVGYLVEILSGMKLDEYLKKNIFDPLGMDDTYFYLPENKASRLVTVYEKVARDSALKITRFNQNQVYPVAGAKKYFSGGAGLVGTIEDYAKFCQMLLNGGEFNNHRILGRKTIELMTTNQIGDLTVWDTGDKFGLGFELSTERGGHAKHPGSLGEFKWGGMYCTDYYIDPKEDMICLFYTNVHPYALYGEAVEKWRVLAYQALVN